MTPIVVIHGWSDHSATFEPLIKAVKKQTKREINNLWLADYVSLDDDVTMADITVVMEQAWSKAGLPFEANSVDVIVHSTGGLVIRDWMRYRHSSGNTIPVRNLVMLAPANHGSPLAHKGRSILGRVVKGYNSDKTFQTGTHILKALEMASPYSWQLARDDRFSANAFKQGGVNCTVIVGNQGYSGISGLANENGTDGTVYVATANLNCARLDIKVARETGEMHTSTVEHSLGKTAFLILDGFNHSDITGKDRLPKKLVKPILQALQVTNKSFPDWCLACEQNTQKIHKKYRKTKDPEQHAFQNMVFQVVDDSDMAVTDYVLEFYGVFSDFKDKMATLFNKHIARKKHAYGDDQSYRSFMMDITSMNQLIDKVDETLKISLSALPNINDDSTLVGYKTFSDTDIGKIELKRLDLSQYFFPDRTLYVKITLPRYQKEQVFNLRYL